MRPLLSLLLAFLGLFSFAQQNQQSPYAKFGKITAEDLQRKIYSLDSSAKAVVLSDIGEASVEGNTKGGFSVYTIRHKVVHILTKSAYDEATVEVPLYVEGMDGEEMVDLKAVTYNLQNGQVVESKLEKSSVFTEKEDKNHLLKKFTMPNVKEGSIIEYQYKVASDYFTQVDPWIFQTHLPTLWSEFVFSTPDLFSYTFVTHGYIRPFINEKKTRSAAFSISENRTSGPTERVNFQANVTDNRWVLKDVPELKLEKFTSTLRNHIAQLEMQLVSRNMPLEPRSYRSTWPALTKELMDADYFGNDLKGTNGWASNEIKSMTAGASTDMEKAKKIYQYVRDHFTCTGSRGIGADQSLKGTFKAGKGTVAEINLLLTALLRNAGLQADPVILSTTNHGYTFEYYPMLSRFNYVVTKVQAADKTFYLDAAHNHLGFAKLLPDCYNGHARVVNEEATPVYLLADSLRDKKQTVMYFFKGDKSLWEGTMSQSPGYYESYELREKIKADGQEKFFKDLQKDYGSDIKLTNAGVDSLNNYDDPIAIHYNMDFNPPKEDILYINPLFGEAQRHNPFQSAQRLYPVEMPFTTDETVIVNMEIPDGYEVDELPKQMKAKYDQEGKTFFEYLIQSSGGTISLRSRIKIDRAYYEPDEYEALREFFNLVVKKQNEQIVLKKKK